MNQSNPMTSSRTDGQALIPVLLVVMILTALATAIVATSRREIKAATNSLATGQADFIARGAVQYTLAALEQAASSGATIPQLTQPPDTDSNGWTQVGDAFYKVDVIDTASRVNINTADFATLSKLPAFQQDPNLAAAIIDWRDADETAFSASGATGAESEYYQSQNPPYSSKNLPFDSVAELLQVRGFTPTILYGVQGQIPGLDSTVSNSVSGSISRAPTSRQAGSAAPAQTIINIGDSTNSLYDQLTTYSREANLAPDGTKKINVKTAQQSAITTLMTNQGISAGQARQVVTQFMQQRDQVTTMADLLGKMTGGNIQVAPWPRTIMQKIADYICVSDTPYVDGPININTATPEALSALPGMTQDLYNAIISARQGGTVYNLVSDLFQGNTFTLQQLQLLYGKVCVRSSVYLIRVRVRVPGTSKTFAAEAIVELAGNPATSTTSTATSAAQTNDPKVLMFRMVPRTPGWSGWSPGYNYYSTSGGTLAAG